MNYNSRCTNNFYHSNASDSNIDVVGSNVHNKNVNSDAYTPTHKENSSTTNTHKVDLITNNLRISQLGAYTYSSIGKHSDDDKQEIHGAK